MQLSYITVTRQIIFTCLGGTHEPIRGRQPPTGHDALGLHSQGSDNLIHASVKIFCHVGTLRIMNGAKSTKIVCEVSPEYEAMHWKQCAVHLCPGPASIYTHWKLSHVNEEAFDSMNI